MTRKGADRHERSPSEQAGRPSRFDGKGALFRLVELYRRFQLAFEILIFRLPTPPVVCTV
jgi:hypothetical protein